MPTLDDLRGSVTSFTNTPCGCWGLCLVRAVRRPSLQLIVQTLLRRLRLQLPLPGRRAGTWDAVSEKGACRPQKARRHPPLQAHVPGGWTSSHTAHLPAPLSAGVKGICKNANKDNFKISFTPQLCHHSQVNTGMVWKPTA